MIIRNYAEGDSDEVYSIALSSLDEMYDPSVFFYFHSQWPEGQLVACDDSLRPIGFLFSARIDKEAKIMMFAVRSDKRNKGIGQVLMDHFREVAMMSGVSSITLEVRTTNTDAMRFYHKNGFRDKEILHHFYKDGGDGLRMVGGLNITN